MDSSLRLSVVLPAAGTGERVGSTVPKQFVLVNGRPLLYHTILAFEFLGDCLLSLIVVLPEKCLVASKLRDLLPEAMRQKVLFVPGSTTRHRSISSGIEIACKDKPDLIVLHDAVRPLVDKELLRLLISEANTHGASGPVCKLTSTVLKIQEDGFLDHALDRDKYRASEMPQVFRTEIIKLAYEKCSDYDLDHGTECLDLVRKYAGTRAKFVEGDANALWKVTYKKDFVAAAYCLSCDSRNGKISWNGVPD